ncbi:MAG TPA: carbohydrate kinase family protein [Anaerolineales bacterium]|nr:carbohydrate kinase family protein [Anaerolineales bacterium]
MNIALTGSIAFDYLMSFPGRFRDHILADRLDRLSLSFLVDSLTRRRGGIAANIAYTLALLGERPRVMATVGEDFDEYGRWLEAQGVDTSAIRKIPGTFTASFFVNTDQANAQIASFYAGAMARAGELHFSDLQPRPDLAVISPNDPDAMALYVTECQSLGIAYIYDPSQQIVRLEADVLRAGIRSCRALFCNDYEFGLVTEKTDLTLDAILQQTEILIITRGEHGADVYSRDEMLHVPAVPPQAVADPTGVGDAFRGGFLKGYAHGLSLEGCGQLGALAATYCLEQEGTQGHRFTLDEFKSRFRRTFGATNDIERLT